MILCKRIASLTFAAAFLCGGALTGKAGAAPAKPKAGPPVQAADQGPGGTRVIGAAQAREIKLQANKSIILELPGDAKDILVSNPDIADVIVRSQRRVFLTGKKVGSTNIFFFDENSRQIASVDLVIERDIESLNRTLARIFPNSDVRAEGTGDTVVLSGTVPTDSDVAMAMSVARSALGSASNASSASSGASTSSSASSGSSSSEPMIVNALKILGKAQVQLRVVIAEVNRDALKQIGVDLNGKQYGLNATSPVTDSAGTTIGEQAAAATNYGPQGNGFASGATNSLEGLATAAGGGFAGMFALPITHFAGQMSASATVKALEKVGLSKTLAEPTLTAISGEEAKFLAGGQFPYRSGTSPTAGDTFGFKDFGVGLAFNPIVLSEGRISVRVKTEVSEINTALSVGGVPGVDVRSAETALELPSGGSMMIAGLLRDTTKRASKGIPGLRRLPVLGTLFSSQEFINNQTELVVIVTPYIVNPVARKDLALPTDGFVNASEPEALLLGRLNKVYGVRGRAPDTPYHGNIGFIYQ